MTVKHVVAAVIIEDGKVLATQRGYGEYKDFWEFPGGKVEPGETEEAALVRELEEEMACRIEVQESIGRIEYDYPAFHLSMNCFRCTLARETTVKLLEHEAAKWLSPAELYEVNWLPADISILETVKKCLAEGRKLAVVFPGIGYTVDKPLLHYSRRIAAGRGYEIKLLPYKGFPKKVIGDRDKMTESYRIALQQAGEMLAGTDFSAYEEILFIGKSVGTIVAAELAAESAVKDRIRLLLFTPLAKTFSFSFGDAAVFTGSADPWVRDAEEIPRLCRERGIPCFVIEDANHSLETKDIQKDLVNLQAILREAEQFVSRT